MIVLFVTEQDYTTTPQLAIEMHVTKYIYWNTKTLIYTFHPFVCDIFSNFNVNHNTITLAQHLNPIHEPHPSPSVRHQFGNFDNLQLLSHCYVTIFLLANDLNSKQKSKVAHLS